MKEQHYTIEMVNVANETENVASDCNSITFTNKKIAIVYIENFPLNQFDSISFAGNFGEVCTKKFNIKGNTLGGLWVFRKIYTNG